MNLALFWDIFFLPKCVLRMEFHPFFGKGLFCLIPLDEVLHRNHIDLGSLGLACGTAVVVSAAERCIIGHNKQCHGIRNKVQLDVIVIPELPLRLIPVIDMPVDNHTVVKAYRVFVLEKTPHSRIQISSDIVVGTLPTLLSREQSVNTN